MSVALLGYANYLVFVRRQGQLRARVWVAVMTVGSLVGWLYNFLHH